MPDPQRIEPTEELLLCLFQAQRQHMLDLVGSPYNRFGDDWGDDTRACLEIFTFLFEARCDQSDLKALDVFINTPMVPEEEITREDALDDIPHPDGGNHMIPRLALWAGTDGIANAIRDLNCLALPKED